MNPSDTIIAFDLHSVVFTPDWKQVGKIFLHWPHKLYMIMCIFRFKLMWQCLTLYFHEPTDEEYFTLLHERCPTLLPLAIELFNSFKPMDATIKVVIELKSKGYTLHIISNVGPRRFKRLKERFPQIIDLFDQAKINNGKPHAIIKKPNPQFFSDYLQEFNPLGEKVIFIDNDKKNIKSAEKFGIIGIIFKSPAQLRTALATFNIL